MGSAKVAGRTLYEGKTSDQIFNYLFTNKGALGKVVQKAIESYQMGDNLWKLYGYNFTKSQLNAATVILVFLGKTCPNDSKNSTISGL